MTASADRVNLGFHAVSIGFASFCTAPDDAKLRVCDFATQGAPLWLCAYGCALLLLQARLWRDSSSSLFSPHALHMWLDLRHMAVLSGLWRPSRSQSVIEASIRPELYFLWTSFLANLPNVVAVFERKRTQLDS
jgi:hypothetical protein